MDVLVLSAAGDGVGIALRLQNEGHNVRLFSERETPAGTGLVKKVLRDHRLFDTQGGKVTVHQETLKLLTGLGSDLVIGDHYIFGYVEDVGWGCPTIGLSKPLIATQADADVMRQAITACGLEPSPTASMASVLAGFNGEAFTGPILLAFPRHGLMQGDLGAYVEYTCATASSISAGCRLVAERLAPLTELLQGYRGLIEMSLSAEGVLGFSTVPCPPLWAMLAEGLAGGLGAYLRILGEGRRASTELRGDWIASALVSVPPYPFGAGLPDNESAEIPGLCSDNRKHLWLMDVEETDGRVSIAGATNVVAVATAYGPSVGVVRGRVVRTLTQLGIRCAQYRTDVGRDAGARLREFERAGWLNRPTGEDHGQTQADLRSGSAARRTAQAPA